METQFEIQEKIKFILFERTYEIYTMDTPYVERFVDKLLQLLNDKKSNITKEEGECILSDVITNDCLKINYEDSPQNWADEVFDEKMEEYDSNYYDY